MTITAPSKQKSTYNRQFARLHTVTKYNKSNKKKRRTGDLSIRCSITKKVLGHNHKKKPICPNERRHLFFERLLNQSFCDL